MHRVIVNIDFRLVHYYILWPALLFVLIRFIRRKSSLTVSPSCIANPWLNLKRINFIYG
jgi:hypothetical protein